MYDTYNTRLDYGNDRSFEEHSYPEQQSKLYDSFRSHDSYDAEWSNERESRPHDPYISRDERSALLAKYSTMAKSYDSTNTKPDTSPYDESLDEDLVVTKTGDVIPRSRERSPAAPRRVHFSSLSPNHHRDYSPAKQDEDKWQEPRRFFSTTLSAAEPTRHDSSRRRDKQASAQEFR
jgi:hypothetical protein